MSNTISMQTDTAQATVDTLRRGSRYFNRLVLQMNLHYRILSAAWLGDRGEEYSGQIRRICRMLEERTSELEIMAERLQNEVFEWEAMDKTLGQPVKRYPAVVAAILSGAGITSAAGEVLGTSTTIYDQMSWADKFALQRELAKKIAEMKGKYGLTGSDEEIAAMYADLEKKIKDLEEKRRQAQENADRWYNKILPDLPLEGDSEDGVPWRVRADDYEDEIKGYDAELAQLRAKRDDLAGLMDLQGQQNGLSENIAAGIPEDGPTKPSLKNVLGGCTNYVAGRRDVSGFFKGGHMNACYWDENAKAAGFDVGNTPVKGSIMVFEADAGKDNGIRIVTNGVITKSPMNADNSAGHVAIVTGTQRIDGGYNVTIDQANTAYSNGQYIAGSYVNKNTMTVFVPDGNSMASYIYDRK